jgi:hypothetical protein
MRSGGSVRHSRLAILGILLCLLAAVFAFEAKIAWYGPAGSASLLISSTKLQTADAPKLISHASSVPAPPFLHFIENFASVLALALLCLPLMSRAARTAPAPLQVSASPSFSTPLFFRPPPVL